MALNFENNNEMDRLFFLQLLVDNMCIDHTRTGLKIPPERISVRFHFLNFPPVELVEEDFWQLLSTNGSEPVKFKSGRSCIFSLQNVTQGKAPLHVGLEVFGHYESSKSILVARTCIPLGECFTGILNALRCSCGSEPVSKATKNSYPLVGNNGVDIGKIAIFFIVSLNGGIESGI